MIEIEKDSNGTEHKIMNGTVYPIGTPDEVIRWLETSRERKKRIRIFYGDDGKCWNDEWGMIGHVGRSTGIRKVPLMIANARAYGGAPLLADRIVRIDTKDERGKIITVYKNPGVRFDKFVSSDIGNVFNETRNELYARCKNGDAGKRVAAYMNGERWAK